MVPLHLGTQLDCTGVVRIRFRTHLDAQGWFSYIRGPIWTAHVWFAFIWEPIWTAQVLFASILGPIWIAQLWFS